jgi:DNA-binding transcriptional LysR family regulator
MYDLPRLQVLLAVMETGSVTAAADQLHMSPSGVSQQLKKLEVEVGLPLLQRHARGMHPTEGGHVLASHARRALRELDAARSDLDEIAGLRRGQLDIGTFPTVASSFLPVAIRAFKQRYPSIQLRVHSARRDTLIRLLEEGAIALSLLWDFSWDRITNDKLRVRKLFDDPMVLVVAHDHPLVDAGEVTMRVLAQEEWILRADDHPVVEVMRRASRRAEFEPKVAFYANDYAEAQAMVSVGLGVALIPRTAMANQHPNVRMISLGKSVQKRRVLVGYRQERVPGAAELAFGEVLDSLKDAGPVGLDD